MTAVGGSDGQWRWERADLVSGDERPAFGLGFGIGRPAAVGLGYFLFGNFIYLFTIFVFSCGDRTAVENQFLHLDYATHAKILIFADL